MFMEAFFVVVEKTINVNILTLLSVNMVKIKTMSYLLNRESHRHMEKLWAGFLGV